ncbi:MAG: DUF4325 domain-containing protein [Acidobacteria bacterium]|nr:DUF4325 domain-containing protein [Acidobacteriota bacterium]
MSTTERILAYLSAHRSASGGELRTYLGISRQALNVHLRRLIESGKIVKTGSTRMARYGLASQMPPPRTIARRMSLEGLDESVAYDTFATLLNLGPALRPNVAAIVRYAFTEMLNNAIEHSGADECHVTFELAAGFLAFTIRDRGVGAFASLASKMGLEDEEAALIELVKGRATARPDSHSGEGIFFTSRCADRFVLRSHRIQLERSAIKGDVFVARKRFIEGTHVQFLIQLTSRRKLEDVFEKFAPAEYDFEFEKTRIRVTLLRTSYVSRSEAKRLMANVEKFREVVLDFHGVESIGQGFADEVFRVFSARHPDVRVVTVNVNGVVGAMLRHVQQGS